MSSMHWKETANRSAPVQSTTGWTIGQYHSNASLETKIQARKIKMIG